MPRFPLHDLSDTELEQTDVVAYPAITVIQRGKSQDKVRIAHQPDLSTEALSTLPALQRVLMSGIARLFVRSYSTKMRGGCLRFHAQYLRRIRQPNWHDVPLDAQKALCRKNGGITSAAIQQAVMITYGLTEDELAHLTP